MRVCSDQITISLKKESWIQWTCCNYTEDMCNTLVDWNAYFFFLQSLLMDYIVWLSHEIDKSGRAEMALWIVHLWAWESAVCSGLVTRFHSSSYTVVYEGHYIDLSKCLHFVYNCDKKCQWTLFWCCGIVSIFRAKIVQFLLHLLCILEYF